MIKKFRINNLLIIIDDDLFAHAQFQFNQQILYLRNVEVTFIYQFTV